MGDEVDARARNSRPEAAAIFGPRVGLYDQASTDEPDDRVPGRDNPDAARSIQSLHCSVHARQMRGGADLPVTRLGSRTSMDDHDPMSSRRETFHFVGQAYGGRRPLDDVEIVVDNNVVSLLDSVARKGYRDANVQHRRVRNLYRWIERRRNVRINHYLGCIEGANFDGFTVSPYNLHKRMSSAGILLGLARTGADADAFNGDPILQAVRSAEQASLDDAVDSARRHFGAVVLPNYVAILQWHLLRQERDDLDTIERLWELHERLAASMNFVPLACSMLLYAELGTTQVADVVGKGLLKLHDRSLARSARSGAWDVGFLSYLSQLRLGDLVEGDETTTPILVTDDAKFAEAARLLPAIGNSGLFVLDREHFRDPNLATRLSRELLESRALASPQFPSWARLIDLARSLEGELGVDPEQRLRIDSPVVRLAPDGTRMNEILDLLPLPVEDLLPLIEDEPLQLYSSLFVARFALEASKEDDDVALSHALRRVAPEAIENIHDGAANSFLAALGLIHAWGRGDDSRTTAYLEAVEINHYPRLVKFIVIRLCAELIAMSAERQNITAEEVTTRLRATFHNFPSQSEGPILERKTHGIDLR